MAEEVGLSSLHHHPFDSLSKLGQFYFRECNGERPDPLLRVNRFAD